MTPFIPHISDDSTSDLACGHYDPLAAMRTETEVSKSKSYRLHSGDHSCATATTAASKAPLKRDKIPSHSSINYCLFFSPRNREKVTTKALKATSFLCYEVAFSYKIHYAFFRLLENNEGPKGYTALHLLVQNMEGAKRRQQIHNASGEHA